MTIKEQLDHALEYRYPVKVVFTSDSCPQTGMIWCDGSETQFAFDESGEHYRQYSDVVAVEPIVPKAPSILDEEWLVECSDGEFWIQTEANCEIIADIQAINKPMRASQIAAAPDLCRALVIVNVNHQAPLDGHVMVRLSMVQWHDIKAALKKAGLE